MPKNEVVQGLGLDEYKYDFVDEEQHVCGTLAWICICIDDLKLKTNAFSDIKFIN